MTDVAIEVYEAFKDAGVSDEKAKHAAAALSRQSRREADKVKQHFADRIEEHVRTGDVKFDAIMQRLDKMDIKLEKLDKMGQDLAVGKWMLAIIIVVVVVPTLKDWLQL